MQARRVHDHAKLLKVMRVTKLMQRKGLFDRGTPMVTTGSQNSASSLATMRSQAQASIKPPAMHLPCTSAIVGFARLRQRRVICR
jgi:hypothetical protein